MGYNMRLTPEIIKSTLELLNIGDHKGVGHCVEIAKGRHYLPDSVNKLLKLLRRELRWQKKSHFR